ncbi:MAG: aminopeptidase P N-terminal domain-containing protein, partial [Acidobacteria bacterium]|nr:aminopeptidase P N-terminal domain-containing protein [Acidobacteriota bacterium]
MTAPVRCLSLLLLCAFGLSAADLAADLAERRARLMRQLGPQTMLIARGAEHRIYSLDVDYEYRQESNFYYLTGIELPDAALVLLPGVEGERREILFVPERDPVREHWTGRLPSFDDAGRTSGIKTVLPIGELDRFIDALASGRPYRAHADRYKPPTRDFDAFLATMNAGQARVAVVLAGFPSLNAPPDPTAELANRIRDRFPGVSTYDATHLVHALRQVKSPYEIELLRRSGVISSDAHRAGMKAAAPGAYEYNVTAAIEGVYRDEGAMGWGYPSIVGSGPNATILHYNSGRRRMDAGDVLLVDAAANYQYYTVDITRTYPVSGKFTQAQKDLYSLALAAQDAARKVAKRGALVFDVHQKTIDVIEKGLLDLGLITKADGAQYRTWYTHGSVHYIGMDVHDVG